MVFVLGELHSKEADLILARAQQEFHADFDIHKKVFVMDAHLAMASEFKAFRSHMSDVKERITRVSELSKQIATSRDKTKKYFKFVENIQKLNI